MRLPEQRASGYFTRPRPGRKAAKPKPKVDAMNKRASVASRIPVYDTIQSNDLKNSFVNRAIENWNGLPQELWELPPKKFKKALTEHLRKEQLRD